MICEDKETNDNWKKNNNMNLSASAFNSCMIEFSIPDFNATIIKNIIFLCRCTSFPFYDGLLLLPSTDARLN